VTLAKRIIPCLDVDGGRVVKGVRFQNLVDAGDPVEVARAYDDKGADELVFLDITASSDNRESVADLIQAVASEVFIPLTVGGGVRSGADVRRLLHAGADKIAVNTAALTSPDLINEASYLFGSQCIVVAIDARRVPGSTDDAPKWEVYTHGGRKNTGRDVEDWAREAVARGAGELLVTSMDRDGTKSGFDLRLLQNLHQHVAVPVIASGGVGSLEHLAEGIIEGHADAVLAASIFHFGTFTIREAKEYLVNRGVPVRLEP